MLPQFGSFYSSLAPHLGWAQQLLPFSCQKKMSLRHSIHSLAGQPRLEQVLQSLSKCLVSLWYSLILHDLRWSSMMCYSRANSANLHQLYVEPNDAKSKTSVKKAERPRMGYMTNIQMILHKHIWQHTTSSLVPSLGQAQGWCLCSCYSSFQERDATKHEKNKLFLVFWGCQEQTTCRAIDCPKPASHPSSRGLIGHLHFLARVLQVWPFKCWYVGVGQKLLPQNWGNCSETWPILCFHSVHWYFILGPDPSRKEVFAFWLFWTSNANALHFSLLLRFLLPERIVVLWRGATFNGKIGCSKCWCLRILFWSLPSLCLPLLLPLAAE